MATAQLVPQPGMLVAGGISGLLHVRLSGRVLRIHHSRPLLPC